MKTAIAAFAACAAGLTIGFFAGRARALRAADPDGFQRNPLPSFSAAEVASGGSRGDRDASLEAKLAKAEAELAELRARMAGASRARLDTLLLRAGELLRGRRGPELLRLMGELAALGDEGKAEAATIWQALIDEPGFGVDYSDRIAALTHWIPDLALWALAHPGEASGELRTEAASAFAESHPPAASALAVLKEERDPQVAQKLAIFMSADVDESMMRDLESVARAHAEDPHVVDAMLLRIRDLETDDSEALLRALAHDGDERVAEAAAWQLLRGAPPAAGMQVDRIPEAGHTGFRRGDVITAVDGSPIGSLEDWRKAQSALAEAEADVVLTVNRNGVTIPLRIPGRSLSDVAARDYVVPKE